MTTPDDRETLTRLLADSLNVVAPLRYIFGEEGREYSDAVEALLAQEIDNAADVLLAAGFRQVEATARVGASSRPLRDAAAWLVDTGWPFDWHSDIPMPHALAEAVIDHIHADPTGGLHGNRLDRDEVEDWIADEAGHRWRAQAKGVEDGGGER